MGCWFPSRRLHLEIKPLGESQLQVRIVTFFDFSWVIENGPVYVDKTATFLKPYAQLGRDLSFIAFNVSKRVAYNVTTYFNEYYPVADYWVCLAK